MSPLVRKTAFWTVVAALALALLWKLQLRAPLEGLLLRVKDLGPWGPLAYIGLYVAACVLLLPGMVIGFGGGMLFGARLGFVYASIGSALGAAAAFLVGRHLVRGLVEDWVAHHRLYRVFRRAVEEGGWRIVGLSRLSPLMPFSLLNYVFGLCRVSLRGFFFATWIGIMPETALQVYLGALVREGLHGSKRTPAEWALLVLGLLATLALAAYSARLAGRALRRQIHLEAGGA